MGGICVKPVGIKDSPRRRSKVSSEPRFTSSKGDESFRVKSRAEIRIGSVEKRLNLGDDDYDYEKKKKREVSEVLVANFSGILTIPKAVDGEQVVAGWPSWLVAVAGEAIHGWLPRKTDAFEKLDKIGQGTYSNVYKARDLVNNKIVALKRVRFDNMDPESVKFMAREILILRRLDHPNIIKLEGLITSRNSCSLYLVFEYMEHDLTGLASLPGVKFTEPQVKCYMKQLLSGLDHCHSRGVLHRDIKGSNLLIDNDGILKIADFGLASFFDSHRNVSLTSRVVTLWYRPPELLLGATRYGASVDLWSSGCILGELFAGKPIMPGRTEVEQLHKIFKLCGSPSEDFWRKSNLPHSTVFKPTQPYRRRIEETFKDFPVSAIDLMETLLAIDPVLRGTATFALNSEFFKTEPYACDPSSLPKYPPSKEIDAKMRDEEARRRRAHVKGQKSENESRGIKEPQIDGAPYADAVLDSSMQVRKNQQGLVKSKSRSNIINSFKEDTASGFPMEQPRPLKDRSEDMKHSYSGPLVAGFAWAKSGKEFDERRNETGRLSALSQEMRDTRALDRKTQELRTSAKEQSMYGHAYNGNKIRFSGPLASSNMDQMLKDHDRHVQQAVRRARIEKTRPHNAQTERTQTRANPMYVSSRRAR